ncbi:MAG: AraC family transcriptional regulator [Glaciimonas sp.]|nr:AraC family transcriptional regulator [Glaciimonas sp.]
MNVPLATMQTFRATTPEAAKVLSESEFGPSRMKFSSPGKSVDLRINRTRIGRLSVVEIDYGAALEIEPSLGKDEYVIQTTLAGTYVADGPSGALKCSRGTTIVGSPSVPSQFVMDNQCRRLCILVNRQQVDAAFSEHFGFKSPRPIEFARQISRQGGLSQRWHALSHFLLAEMMTRGSARRNPVIDHQIESVVISTLLFDHLADAGGIVPGTYKSVLPHYVKRAMEYLRANLNKSPTMADVANYSGVSERTLQSAFRKYKGATPMDYLRQLRLNQAREELLKAAPQRGAVTQIAMQYGFNHLSAFSHEYEKLFGELPSATLARRSAEN